MRTRPRDLHRLPSDDWLEWSTIVGINGWADYGSGYSPGGYTVDELGYVCLRGLIKNPNNITTWSTIFTLPHDLRPGEMEMFMGMGSAGGGIGPYRIDIGWQGRVEYSPVTTGAVAWLSLAAIRFRPAKESYNE